MKIIPRALSAGLALAAVPAQAFVTYQDIVSAATNPDDLSRQALVTIFGDVVTNPLTASSNTIIGNLFMVFNAIIAIMGIVWFLFIESAMLSAPATRAMSLTTDGTSSECSVL